MPHNERSRNVTQGVARSANRAMYYAMGYRDQDFDRPMIGVANAHSTITPCTSGRERLADAAVPERDRREASRHTSGVRTVNDGMGRDEGAMKSPVGPPGVMAQTLQSFKRA